MTIYTYSNLLTNLVSNVNWFKSSKEQDNLIAYCILLGLTFHVCLSLCLRVQRSWKVIGAFFFISLHKNVFRKPVHTYIEAYKHLPKYPLLHSWDITHRYWKGENKSGHIISPGSKNPYGMWLCGLGVRDEVEGVLGGRVGVKEVEWARFDTFASSTNKIVERVMFWLWIIPKRRKTHKHTPEAPQASFKL